MFSEGSAGCGCQPARLTITKGPTSMNQKQKLIAAVGALLAAGTIGGAGMALANATPAPAPPPPPPTSQACDAPEAGDTPDQPGGPDSDNVQKGDQGGPETPDAPCG